MHLFIGVALAAAVAAFARWGGMDRDRSFYPTVMMVIALIYVLFAAVAGSPTALVVEMLIGAGFIALAFAGFRRSLWLVVVALAGHGVFDYFHPHAIHNPGVPVWWPDFCMAYDIAAAVFLGWRLRQDEPAAGEGTTDRTGSGHSAFAKSEEDGANNARRPHVHGVNRTQHRKSITTVSVRPPASQIEGASFERRMA